MKKRTVKVLSIVLALVMMLSVFPVQAFAAPANRGGIGVETPLDPRLDGFDDNWGDRWGRAFDRLIGWFFGGHKPKVDPMPAVSLVSEDVEGMLVAVDAPEGALPEGATMETVKVDNMDAVQAAVDNTDGVNGTVLAAVDITFRDKNGGVIQPGKEITVTIKSAEIAGRDDLSVVHLDLNADELGENNVDAEPVTNAEFEANTVTFQAKSFSVYAVVDEGEETNRSRLNVQFYDSTRDGAEPIYEIKVTPEDADILDIIIADPPVEQYQGTKMFCGWSVGNADYTSDDVDGQHTIERVREQVKARLQDSANPVAEGEVLKVYAMYFNFFTITYVNETGNVKLYTQAVYTKDASYTYELQMLYSPEQSGFRFAGWVRVGDSSNTVLENGTEVEITENTTFRAKVEKGIWITFNEAPGTQDKYKGATYHPPVFCLDGNVTASDKPADPVLPGYTFGGWYLNYTEGTGNNPDTWSNPFTFSGKVQANITVYAKWTLNAAANYTVLIWKQNLAGNGYDFAESRTLSGTPNSTVNTVSSQGTGNNTYARINGEDVKYTGFKLKEFDQNVTIMPDGSAVVNVYYDRNQYTLTFQAEKHTSISGTPTLSNAPTSYTGSPITAYFIQYGNYGYCPVSRYSGTQAIVYIPTTDSYSSTDAQYGVVDGKLYRLRYAQNTTTGSYAWWYGSNSTLYSGQRYKQYTTVYTSSYNNKFYTLNWQTVRTITGLYGTDISSYFAITDENDGTSYSGYVWEPQDSAIFTTGDVPMLETMPAENTTFRAKVYGTGSVNHFIYYTQCLPGETGDYTYGGKQYKLHQDVVINASAAGMSSTQAEDFIDIQGFTQDTTNPAYNSEGKLDLDDSNDYTIRFFYDRNSYRILYQDGIFLNGNQQVDSTVAASSYLGQSDLIAYQADITSYNESGANYFVPTHEGYKFLGWYYDKACSAGKEVNFSTMPLDGVTVYAKWQLLQVRVVLFVDGGTLPSGQSGDFRIASESMISKGQTILPTKQGYELVGWYTDENYTDPFHFATKLYYHEGDSSSTADQYTDSEKATYGDTGRDWVTGIRKLYAKWRRSLPDANGITVVYDGRHTSGTGHIDGAFTWTDPMPYADQAKAIARAASTPDLETKRFLYWELEKSDGTIQHFYPGQMFTVDFDDAVESNVNNGSSVPSPVAGAFRDGIAKSGAPVSVNSVPGIRPLGDASPVVSWDFEDNSLTGWKTIDNDGDDNNWRVLSNPSDGTISHGGSYYLRSDSYINGSGALTPDNFIISPAVSLPATGTNTLHLWAKGVDASYPAEHLEVYVTTKGNSVQGVTNSGTRLIAATTTGTYTEYTAELPASYAGQSVYIALRHCDTSDQFAIAVDDIAITNDGSSGQGNTQEVWAPTDTIVVGEEYLIGFVVDGAVYLAVNYNVDASNHYYYNSSGNYYGYTAPATLEGENVVAVSGNATDLQYCTWKFSTTTGGTITSGYESNRALYGYTSSSYGDLYPDTTSLGTSSWTWNATNHTLKLSSATRYAQYHNQGSGNYMKVASTAPTNGTVQLYHKEIIDVATYYTVNFYGWNDELIKTEQVKENSAATAPDPVPCPEGYKFDSWDTSFDYITEDTDVHANFTTVSGANVYTVVFATWDGETISVQTVEEGSAATAPTAPDRTSEGYRFVGWDTDYTNVQDDLYVTAMYEKIVTKQYTVTLHAVYADKVEQRETHIYWYANNNDQAYFNGAGPRQVNAPIISNEAVNIPTPDTFTYTDNSDAQQTGLPARPGYKFIGWAKIDVVGSEDDNTYVTAYHPELDSEDDLFLKWDPDYEWAPDPEQPDVKVKGGYFAHIPESDTSETSWKHVTQVAADELQPYNDLYAVWEPEVFYVYHSFTGKLEAVRMVDCNADGTFDLTAAVSDGALYGGYYETFNGLKGVSADTMDAAKASAKAADDHMAAVEGAKLYTGDKAYVSGLTKWWVSPITNVKGSEVVPVAGNVYYPKEVPAKYLTSRIQYIFKWSQENKISDIYLLTVLDDKNYSEVGFEITADNTKIATLAGSFTFVQHETNQEITVKPADFTGVNRGFIGYANAEFEKMEDGFLNPDLAFTMTPYWITPDGETITGTARSFEHAGDKDTIVEVTNP